MTSASAPAKIKGTSITTPSATQDNHTLVLGQLKEVAEIAQRLRGDPQDSFVRVSELTAATGARLVNGTIQPANTPASSSSGGTVAVADSITGTGASGSPLQLSGDSASPGNTMLYGTNGSGTKGWYAQSGGSGAAANITPDTHPLNPTALDDEFEESSLSSQWTWVNKSSDSVAFSAGALEYTGALNNSQSTAFIAEPILSTTAWRYRMKMRAIISSAYNNGGLILYESASGKSMEFGLLNNGGTPNIWVSYMPNFTTNLPPTYNSFNGIFPVGTGSSSDPIYLEVQLVSGTLHFRYSLSGYDEDFVTYYSVTVGTYFTTAPDHVGIGGWSQNATVPLVLLVDWFRDYTNGY